MMRVQARLSLDQMATQIQLHSVIYSMYTAIHTPDKWNAMITVNHILF